MSDSVFLFRDPVDSLWDHDKLEPDNLEISHEMETTIHELGVGDDGLIRDDAGDSAKVGDASCPKEEQWSDLALEEFVIESQHEKLDNEVEELPPNDSSALS